VIHLADEIVAVEKGNYKAWILRGNAYYYKQNLFDSEESYIKAVRCKSDRNERFDLQMLFQLGMTYIKRKTWKDAKVVFHQILKENSGYSFAWSYLGVSLMKLNEYQSAEEAFNEANLLDVENPTIWAYLCIYCIYVDRHFQAFECLNELMKMDFNNVELLEDIAILFCKKGQSNVGAEIYNKILLINPNNVDIYIKLAGVYLQIDTKKHDALELLKNRFKLSEDENEKKKIKKFIDFINKEVGMDSNENNLIINSDSVYDEEGENDFGEMGGDSMNVSKLI
jgi:tetratricopeptide (TPR) repeat protein